MYTVRKYHIIVLKNEMEMNLMMMLSLTYITQITNQLHQSRKAAAVYILLPRKRKIYVPTKLPRKTEGNGFAINLHFLSDRGQQNSIN
jgi:hypothetical protein